MSVKSDVIIILGGPGAGKSTVSNIIHQNLKNALHLKTGQIMRSAIISEDKVSSQEKDEVNAIMQDGGLVKDEIVAKLLNKEITNILTTKPDSKFVLDGFPRTVGQLKALLAIVNLKVSGALILTAPNSIMEKRCKMRNLRTDRVDDRKGPVEHRIADFTQHITEIRSELKSKKIPTIEIDTCDPMEKMTKKIQDSLKKWNLS